MAALSTPPGAVQLVQHTGPAPIAPVRREERRTQAGSVPTCLADSLPVAPAPGSDASDATSGNFPLGGNQPEVSKSGRVASLGSLKGRLPHRARSGAKRPLPRRD